MKHTKHKETDPVKKAERDFERRIDAYDYILLAASLLTIGAVLGFYIFKSLCTMALPAFVFAAIIAARPVYNYVK